MELTSSSQTVSCLSHPSMIASCLVSFMIMMLNIASIDITMAKVVMIMMKKQKKKMMMMTAMMLMMVLMMIQQQ